jgi:glycosyltransferase involved in cell wall biosynthesis
MWWIGMETPAHDGKSSKHNVDLQPVLCVFPTDTLAASFKKGEVKERYFNPSNLFREIQVISLASHDIDPTRVQRMFGHANVAVHSVGPHSMLGKVLCRFASELYYFAKLRQLLALVNDIRPSVIRAYNPLLQGFLATYVGKKLKIPTVVSVHASHDYDERIIVPKRILFWSHRNPAKALFDFVGLLKFNILSKRLENYSLKSAREVICAYQVPKECVERHRHSNIALIYNRVDTNRFKPVNRSRTGELTILHVGVLTFEKNPENLIRAIVNLPVRLVIVGSGELQEYLKDLGSKLRINGKVQFAPRVDHETIHKLYAQADIFVMCMKVGGVSIPILEAMASGLPIVFTRGIYEIKKEIIDGIGICVEDNPKQIAQALSLLIKDRRLRERLGRKARKKIQSMNGEKMEQLEAALYRKLMK